MKLLNNLSDRSFLALLGVVFIFVIIITFFLASALADATIREFTDTTCLHPVDDSMRIYVYSCLNEGYTFGQCYTEYSDFLHGSERLEMPTTWV